MPGIEATDTRTFVPATTNSGQIRSSAVSAFSRTMRRAHSDLRLRRMRVVRSSGSLRAGASAARRNCTVLSIGRPYLIAIGLLRNGFLLLGPPWPDQRSGSLALHRDLSLQVFLVAVDRGDGQNLAAAAVAQDAVLGRDVAVDRDVVPLLGVADVADRGVVMVAPEERHRGVGQAHSQHVQGGGLALPFGDDPVLDPDRLAGMRVGT